MKPADLRFGEPLLGGGVKADDLKGKVAVVGAESPENLQKAIDQALA